MNTSQKSEFPLAFLAGVVVMLLILGGLYLLTSGPRSPRTVAQEDLPFGDAEKAYAERIRISETSVSRAANFLDQEVTFLFGVVENSGTRSLRALEVTLEFRNLLNEVILRETRRIIDHRTPPLPAGQPREFQITFEQIPAEWNRAVPGIRITGLRLE